MQPTLRFVTAAKNVELAVWDWPGDDPAIVLIHGTGFHGRCWDETIRMLPGRHVIAIDLRCHGRSPTPPPPYSWPLLAEDIAAVMDGLDVRGAIAAGHSMGGHTLAIAATLNPGAFSRLVLIDPVILHERYLIPANNPDFSFAAKRRAYWASVDEFHERLAPRAPFSRWHPAVLRDYCEFALLPDGDRFRLACMPETEAAIYRGACAPEADIRPFLARIAQPALIVRSAIDQPPTGFDMSGTPTRPDLASYIAGSTDMRLDGASHFIPMQRPGFIRDILA